MNRYKSSAELKDMAKGKLEGRYGIAIAAVLLVECIVYLVSSLLSTIVPGRTLGQYILGLLIANIISIFLGIYKTGLSLFFLNMACGQPHQTGDIFYGMMNQPMRSIIVSLATVVLDMICLTPFQIFALLFISTQNIAYVVWMLATAVIGCLIYIPVNLAISQSYYLLLDFPEYSGMDALAASCKLMKGHKKRLFYIELSFLPLMLLGVLTCGIGLLWVKPYMNMTYALFFLDIMNPEKS